MLPKSIIAILVLLLGVLLQESFEYDHIDLDSIRELTLQDEGLLTKLACQEPTSEVCENFNRTGKVHDTELARYWLNHVVNEAHVESKYKNALAAWNYETNISSVTVEAMHEVSRVTSGLTSTVDGQSKLLYTDDLDYHSKRILKFLKTGGFFSSTEQAEEETEIQGRMTSIYGTGRVCRERRDNGRKKKRKRTLECFRMEPGLQDIFSTSRDYDELLWAWKGWRDAVGPKIGQLYPAYVSLLNGAARNGGYDDYGAELRSDYEDPNFVRKIDALWTEVRPMYLQLHAYVRGRLVEQYGEERVNPRGPIPAHLLGNMWAQKWGQIFDLVKPYPEHGIVDVTDEMQRQGWTVGDIFHRADKFFTSLGWEPMPDSFWEKSMLERPSDRQVECHGAASDFFKHRDVRIKMCTEITMEDLYTAHHEMGHCQYFLQYRHQHAVLRNSANPGFHEAVGDTIALSVVTPSYLHHIGLLDDSEVDYKLQINYLMRQALDKISFLPFGLLIDKWRWRVFNGEIEPQDYNTEWWNMRREYQGLKSPIKRGPHDFDPGAKYHIASGTPYIRYFVSFIVQFQFQKALCEIAGHSTEPLHLCNIYESKAAGDRFGSMLRLGKSLPWQQAMEVLTGQRQMAAQPIIEYFKPLVDWLTAENKRRNNFVGWE